jgi:phosphatidylserine/phosphatidylglycerophosphate/cardiolipin synthase-like enzyme
VNAHRRLLLASILAAAAACHEARGPSQPPPRPAAGASVAIQLVESPPAETTLDHPDVPNAADVWVAMIDGAHRTLDFAELYASEADQKDHVASKLAPVLAAVERAVARGVRVRFLADSVFAPKYPETLERLRHVGAAVRILDFSTRGGGILHAKYFVVDGVESFVGSQNFDWRALDHIQEMGVHVSSPLVAGPLLDIFETDWALASGGGGDGAARVHLRPAPPAGAEALALTGERLTLVASPKGYLPEEASWDLPRLVAMLDGAARAVDVQVLTYKTTSRDGSPFPTLDDALRRAAARGVRVRLLVSDWSSKPGSDARKALDALASVPNVEVRVITIPAWSGGEIPFARVAHAKYMVVDGASAWVGTSNWEGDYFTRSRNVGVIASGGALPARLDRIFEDGWGGAYARPLATVDTARTP